jgi:hypothetical protein
VVAVAVILIAWQQMLAAGEASWCAIGGPGTPLRYRLRRARERRAWRHVAHGFAGSKQLMYGFGSYALARAGTG